MSIANRWILFAAGTVSLCAQQGSIGGPVAGYVFDTQAHVLRVIRGIPGASMVDGQVDLGTSVQSAWVAPNLDTTLTVTADGVVRLFGLDRDSATERRVPGLVEPERVVFSPSGGALALVASGKVWIINGLPGLPVVAGVVELPLELAEHNFPSAVAVSTGKRTRPVSGPLAISDDGLYVLYGSGGAVQLLGISGDSRKLTDAEPGAVPAFAPRGHDAAVVDGHVLALFQDVSGAATVRRLPGIAGARGAAFSPRGEKLFIVSTTVTAVNVGTGIRTEIVCGCRPSELMRMGDTFRLNPFGAGPLWLLETAVDPRVNFVPAPVM
jgi:hypothetical protein